MKLQPALIFGENMVLQRGEPLPVWGRSVRGDKVTVTLGGNTAVSDAPQGEWKVTLPAMEATEQTEMTISSQLTGESVTFHNVAVGEVWLAGGQSNMEFLLKYDEQAPEMLETPEDPGFRFFRYPQANFTGCLEMDPYPDDGFWRVWDTPENKGFFSGPSAYMGRKLREALGVPVGFIGVNWGGTPAAAWTAMEDLEQNPALKTVLDWHKEGCAALDLAKYYTVSDKPQPEPSQADQERLERFMMGIGFEEMVGKPPMRMPPMDYSPFMVGPRAAIRPAGLYENILCKVAPYSVRGAIWYQGEDDDARGWYDFYDESMKTLIQSWRKLWGKELPFFQVELAPFEGLGFNNSKEYYTMRDKQRAAADALPGVHDICIMDAGDKLNIHVRKKRPVGERLALLARKYVYGESGLLADSPRATGGTREGNQVRIAFQDAGEGLQVQGDLDAVLEVTVDGNRVSPAASVKGNTLTLTAEEFSTASSICVKFCQLNYCTDPLFNSAGLPAFPFTLNL